LKKNLLITTLLATILFTSNLSAKEEEKTSKFETTFELKSISDNITHVEAKKENIIFKEHNNSVTFLLFFGHNCKPCLKEIPEVNKLVEKKYDDLNLLAIDIHGYNKEDLTDFKKEKEINYPLLTREENKKFINFIKAKTGWRGSLPFMVVFNKKGEPKLAHKGALNFKKFETIYKAVRK